MREINLRLIIKEDIARALVSAAINFASTLFRERRAEIGQVSNYTYLAPM